MFSTELVYIYAQLIQETTSAFLDHIHTVKRRRFVGYYTIAYAFQNAIPELVKVFLFTLLYTYSVFHRSVPLRYYHLWASLFDSLTLAPARQLLHKDILEIGYDAKLLYRNQMNQTRMAYEANLTYPQTVKYLRMLIDLGLLILTDFKPLSLLQNQQ